jgi:co-chaperonin GroES (HSP10)
MEITKVSKGGIILQTEETSEREQMANTTGIVIAMGEECFEKGSRWCEVGDKVIFAKYAGLLYTGKDGVSYRLINDEDITAKLDSDVDLVDPHLTKGL